MQAVGAEPGDIDVAVVLGRIWRQKWYIAMFAVAAIIAAVIYLRTAVPVYKVELRVTPAASSQSAMSGRMPRLSGGLAALVGSSGGTTDSATPFDLYLDALTSREISTVLARDPKVMHTVFAAEWDAREQRWREPRGSIRALIKVAKTVVGSPVKWRSPDAARLQDQLKRTLKITRGTKEPISLIAYQHYDPEFATYLLNQLNRASDDKIRHAALHQASRYAAYLSRRIPSIAVAEHRAALVESLAEQERSIMMTSADVPYAATTLEAPTPSTTPTSPKVTTALLIALLGSLIFGCAIAALDLGGLRKRILESGASGR